MVSYLPKIHAQPFNKAYCSLCCAGYRPNVVRVNSNCYDEPAKLFTFWLCDKLYFHTDCFLHFASWDFSCPYSPQRESDQVILLVLSCCSSLMTFNSKSLKSNELKHMYQGLLNDNKNHIRPHIDSPITVFSTLVIWASKSSVLW